MKTKGFGVTLAVVFISFYLFGLSSLAFAADFRFVIPINFKNIPLENNMRVYVELYDKNGNQMQNVQNMSVISMQAFQGNFNKDVTIDVTVKNGMNPYDAKKYKVYFLIQQGADDQPSPPNNLSKDWTLAKPGTPILDSIEGDIPMQALPVVVVDDKK